MKLFDRFDKVYCVNLDRRTDRLENFQKQVDKYNLGDYTRISAVDGLFLNLLDLKRFFYGWERHSQLRTVCLRLQMHWF